MFNHFFTKYNMFYFVKMQCPTGLNSVYETNISNKCVTSPLFWTDLYGDTCANYENSEYCVVENGIGRPSDNWDVDVFGSFNDVGNPEKHCCYCGGGVNFEIKENIKRCECPRGSFLVEGKCITEDSSKSIIQSGEQKKDICISRPFIDRLGFKCDSYLKNMICDPSKSDKKGVNWNDTMFDSKGLENCCECGGGDTSIEISPIYQVVKNCPVESTYNSDTDQCVCTTSGAQIVNGSCMCPEGQVVKEYPDCRKCEDPSKVKKRKHKPFFLVFVVAIIIYILYKKI